MDDGCALSEVIPSAAMILLGVVVGEDEEVGSQDVEAGLLPVLETLDVLTLTDAYALFNKYGTRRNIGTVRHLHVVVGHRKGHAWLKHHESAQRGEQAVRVRVSLKARHLAFDRLTVEDRKFCIDMFEEEIEAALGDVVGEQSRGWIMMRNRFTLDTIYSGLDFDW